MPASGNNVKGLETSDAIVLVAGSIADGEYLKRDGTTIKSGNPGGGSGLTHPQVLARTMGA
jgi:hypothetical protein